MNKEHSLEEDVRHGTKETPMEAIQFTSGPGTCYSEHFFVQRHWHHNVELLYIIKGSYTVELNLEEHVLRSGDICMINSGELHKIDGNEQETIHEAIIFNPSILAFSYEDEMQQNLIAPFIARTYVLPHVIRQGDSGYEKVQMLYRELAQMGVKKSVGWYMRAKLSLLELLLELKAGGHMITDTSILNAPEKERIDRYKRTVTYMEEHFAEKISLPQLAGAAQCNPQYLCHFFKDVAGVSPIQYLITYRIERAKEMLMDTTKTVLEVGLDCGFENVSYFIRQFKRGTGQTPREYRNVRLG